MDPLHLCHHFFHFNSKQWNFFWEKDSSTRKIEMLFQSELFPRRALKIPFPKNLIEAEIFFNKNLHREESLGIRAIPENHPQYPPSIIEHIPPERRPPILYLRGSEIKSECDLVAMVGTRNPSLFGIEQAKNFSSFFAALKLSIVSGLAKGIDTICHEESLEAGTLAVLGGEIEHVYPAENQKLAEKIVEKGGTILSPFPLNQIPLPHNFPQRNELIAALSAGTLVMEGSEKSGASITGHMALSMGKTTIALSQDFRSNFGRGAVRLQQSGATMVCSEEEALEAIFSRFGGKKMDGKEKKFTFFSFSEFHKINKGSISESIALLEEGLLKGRFKRIGFDRYQMPLERIC